MKECKQLLLLDSNYEVVFLQPISFSMFFSSLPSPSSFVIMVELRCFLCICCACCAFVHLNICVPWSLPGMGTLFVVDRLGRRVALTRRGG